MFGQPLKTVILSINHRPTNRRIRAGSASRNIGGTIHQVEWYLNHPSYGQGLGFDGDITIVKLATPLVYSAAVAQAIIPHLNSKVPDGSAVKHAGWGTTSVCKLF